MPKIKGQHFGQETPKMQIRSIVGSIRGWCWNVREGVSKPGNAVDAIEEGLDRVELILSVCSDLDEWPEDRIDTEEMTVGNLDR